MKKCVKNLENIGSDFIGRLGFAFERIIDKKGAFTEKVK